MRNRIRLVICSYFFWLALLIAGLLLVERPGSRSASLADDEEGPPPKVVKVEPQKEFSITLSSNPSTGFTLGLAYVSEGVFLLRTERAKLAPDSPPGTPSEITFHFYHWHPSQPEEAPEITFGRFQQWDLQGTLREERYVLQIEPAAREISHGYVH